MAMRRRYDRTGILALKPEAFLDLFLEADSGPPRNETRERCEIVTIRGPLDHHEGGWCDSYESIVDRVTAACESPSPTVVLRIDSPGGELGGLFDAARTIRARCAAAGKRLVAYVEGCACSAGYALACAAEQIVASETAYLGSIGIVITRVDVTARDAAMGVGFAVVTSGKRKADGNPHVSLSAAELATLQGQADAMAGLFFDHVAAMRGISAADVAALEAGVFHGAAAVGARLADRVASLDEMLASLAGGTMPPEREETDTEERASTDTAEESRGEASAQDVDDARAALERAAADGDERAQRALDVLNGSDGDEDSEEEGGEEARAGSAAPARAARAATGVRVSAESAAGLAEEVQTLNRRLASLEGERDTLRRTALFESRPDLDRNLVKRLAKLPFEEAKAIVDCLPKAPKPNRAATATVTPMRGATSANGAPRVESSPETEALDRAFGITGPKSGVRREGNSLVFGVPQRRAARLPASTATTPTEPAKG